MQPYKNEKISRAVEEVGRYRKKKQSNISKIKAKSDHKHIKKACLVMSNSEHVFYAEYCTGCGKIINWNLPKVKDAGYYKILNGKEILEKYKDLEIKEIADIHDKYIPIS